MNEFWIQTGIIAASIFAAVFGAIWLLRRWLRRGEIAAVASSLPDTSSFPTAEGTSPSPSTEELRRRIERVRGVETRLERSRQRIEDLRHELDQKLLEAAQLTPAQAREALVENLRAEADEYLEEVRHELFDLPEHKLEERAKLTLLAAMQRIATRPLSEQTSTTLPIPNEEMKGRIIGREGRNIRTFESVTGVSLLIDETPDTVLLSGFDPVRREIARQTLAALIEDGRIHPASIEEKYEQASGEMDKTITTLGEESLRRLHLSRVNPEIVSLLGKLHFRHSNNQNTLQHSEEVAFLCSLLAAEIGFDPDLAKRAGLFHDLGKAIGQEFEGSHAAAAAKVLRHHGECEEVVNAVAASHGEVAAEYPYAGLVMLADSVSAARPGARADSSNGYIQRVRSLENLGRAFEGVRDCYALQAGREIRVIVDPDQLGDAEARVLALKLRSQIEAELHYPSTIKVTVIRESRYSEVAT
jgi:ribonuclease Y